MKKPTSYYTPGKTVRVNDKMQKDYSYKLTAKYGTDFSSNFKPFYTPREMLKMGVFEGKYINDCQNEFPKEWFVDAKVSKFKADSTINYFGIKSRQPLSTWKQKDWIYGNDVRGWFQWYCRYYIGRREPEIDKIQVGRHNSFKRHAGHIRKNCKSGDITCRPKQRQALLQWAYDPFI